MLTSADQMFYGHVALYALAVCAIAGMVIFHNLVTLATSDNTEDK